MNKLAASVTLGLVLVAGGMVLTGCNSNTAPAALQTGPVNLDNYNKITIGMSKAQCETILGPATNEDKKDFLVMKKTTERWEEGTKFIELTFKNDELDTKNSNLQAQ